MNCFLIIKKSLYVLIFIMSCRIFTSCKDNIITEIPIVDYDKDPYKNDINASWSSDLSLLIYYNGSHSDENGIITDSTFGIYIKELATGNTIIWDYHIQSGGGGLSMSPNNQLLVFENVYNIYSIPFEIPFDLSKMEEIGNEIGPNMFPKWSRDGNYIAIDIRLGGNPGIYIMNPDGSNKHHVGPWGGKYPYFTHDNEHIICNAFVSSDHSEIFKINYEENTYLQLTNFEEFHYIYYAIMNNAENMIIFSALRLGEWGPYTYSYNLLTDELIQLTDKYSEIWDWNYEDNTILYTYCPSPEQGEINGFLWSMKPDGSEKVQITFLE